MQEQAAYHGVEHCASGQGCRDGDAKCGARELRVGGAYLAQHHGIGGRSAHADEYHGNSGHRKIAAKQNHDETSQKHREKQIEQRLMGKLAREPRQGKARNSERGHHDGEQQNHIVETVDVLAVPGVRMNPPDRCYLCKKELFTKLKDLTAREGIREIAEGSNLDDNGDYRPGLLAVAELGIRSPLREAGLGKEEIRLLSKERNLPTWDKPSYACLSSRFVYGEEITEKKLSMVDQAEQLLIDLGFRQVRVRIHENLARIEVLPDEIARFSDAALRRSIYEQLHGFGFAYVTLDLMGYRTGSMNEVLDRKAVSAGST